MFFADLFRDARVTPLSLVGDAQVGTLEHDTRRLKPGQVFVCMPSENTDSHEFIPQAIDAGAGAVIAHTQDAKNIVPKGVPLAVLPGGAAFADSLWRLSKTSYGNPSARLKVIGVTGTNGKTTVAWSLRDMFEATGTKAAYMGTLGFRMPGVDRSLPNTTPICIEIDQMLLEAVESGVECFVMEVSSHALDQRRADGVELDVGVFTNLTPEHLDYHPDMASYSAAKKRLFVEVPLNGSKRIRPVLNVDDPTGAAWYAEVSGAIGFGRRGDLQYSNEAVTLDRVSFTVDYRGHSSFAEAPLGGQYNLENCVAALAGFVAAARPLEEGVEALRHVSPVPGRFESVQNDTGIGVLIDYAHTADALAKLLDTVRALTGGRIIVVFGCGGDRDRSKRPQMAKAVSERSDLTIVTTDNPRTEDPKAIELEVMAGIVAGAEVLAIPDRGEAVIEAIRRADPGDVVVIAGKGHERYQIFGRTKVGHDDREFARAALEDKRCFR